jgi:hypothetical protein
MLSSSAFKLADALGVTVGQLVGTEPLPPVKKKEGKG